MADESGRFECGIWDKGGSCMIPLASLEKLPVYHRKIIPSDYQDLMGHMNIRWYFDLFARTGRKLFKAHGLDEDYFKGGESGVFALKHFIQYFAEVRVGQTVAIITHADLLIRRSAPMPAPIIQKLDATLAEHETLDWEAPISGAIKL